MRKWPPPVSNDVLDRQLQLLGRQSPVAVAAGRMPEKPSALPKKQEVGKKK